MEQRLRQAPLFPNFLPMAPQVFVETWPIFLPEMIGEPLVWLPCRKSSCQSIYKALDEDFQERFEAQITKTNGLASKATLVSENLGSLPVSWIRGGTSFPKFAAKRGLVDACLGSFQKARTMDDLLSDFLTETSANLKSVAACAVLFERNPSDSDAVPQNYRFIQGIKGTSGSLGLIGPENAGHAAATLIDSGVSANALLLSAAEAVTPAAPEDRPWTDLPSMAGTSDEAARLIGPGENRKAATNCEPCTAENKTAGTISLPAAALQDITDLVCELVLTRNQIAELSRQHGIGRIKDPLERLSKVTSGLRDAVMRARMQPMTRLFASVQGLIRDLAAELEKKFDLVIDGTGTVLDPKLIETIRDPLTHLIRNCANHGIESPPERIAAGKPEAGRISISAFSNSGEIHIEVADDGRGLDASAIGEKAIERGLADAVTVARMSDDEVYRFILEPGFPSASAVTAGVCSTMSMAAIRAVIEALGGTITLESKKGHGSKFILKIPQTFAIAPALIVKAAGQRFAIPQHYLERAVSLDEETQNLKTMDDVHILRIREELVTAVPLAKVLDLPDAGRMEDKFVIVLGLRGQKLGIIVDEIGEIQDIVVKPLGPLFSSLKMFSGNTILGDGTVILIVDPAGIAAAINMQKTLNLLPSPSVRTAKAAPPSSLLLFKAGSGALKVLPRSAVSRILQIKAQDLSRDGDLYLYRYQERLIPVLRVAEAGQKAGTCLILVIALYNQTFGLWVDSVLDIVESQTGIQLISSSPALLGTATLRGGTVEFIDAGYYYRLAFQEARRPSAGKAEILIVESEPGMHELLKPLLASAGHKVTAVETAEHASELLQHKTFGVILLDAKAASSIDEAALSRQPDALCLIFNGDQNEDAGEHSVSKLDRRNLLSAIGRHLGQLPGSERKADDLNLPHNASFAGSL